MGIVLAFLQLRFDAFVAWHLHTPVELARELEEWNEKNTSFPVLLLEEEVAEVRSTFSGDWHVACHCRDARALTRQLRSRYYEC